MADYYGTDTVVSELREDGLLIIRINRPEVANALNGATSDAMENIMNHAEKDKAVRAIIVTGTGKVFCAGEDLSELSLRAASARPLPSTASAASRLVCAP
ncbi:MAG: enoyl-CoA hydratase/isomerase family protein, partial [Slackia isoflavoniconvertens]|nr:enoyl-CoA hydratase/isomerase family protein [Slackia isoflavoniconvertens]